MSQSSTSTHPTRLPSSHSSACSPPSPPPKDKPSFDPNPSQIQQNQRRRLPKFWRQRTAPQVLSPSLSESSSSSSSSSPSQSPAPSPKIALPFRSWRSGSDRVRRRSSSTQLSTDSHPSSPTLNSTIPVAPPLPESPTTTNTTSTIPSTTAIATAIATPTSTSTVTSATTAPATSTAPATTTTSSDPNGLPSLLQHLMARHDTAQATVAELVGWLAKDIDKRPYDAVVDSLRYLICNSHLSPARMRQCLDQTNEQQSWPALIEQVSCSEHLWITPQNRERYAIDTPRILLERSTVDYTTLWPDHMNPNALWFRRYFVGKPYSTWVSQDEIVSVVRDKGTAYRVIVRSPDPDRAGHYYRVLPEPKRALRILHEDSDDHCKRTAAAMVCPNLRTAYKEISAEQTILAGLEMELLRFDELPIPKHYKFGVLTVRDDQTTEEAWFSNSQLSPSLKQLLHLVGRPVSLRGYTGYAAGLDTKTGETGEISYASRWREYDIMFHIAPLMPCREHDTQQVHRKRHIGNDIVCLVVVEGNAQFNPSVIRSQFLHVFVVVRQVDKDAWLVEIVRNANVPEFGPPIPYPPILSSAELEHFLILKMVNAENAALRSAKFAVPNAKARAGILQSMITSSARQKDDHQHTPVERPRSTGFHSPVRQSLDSEPPTPPLPPPTPTRSQSTLLRNLPFARRANPSASPPLREEDEEERKPKKITILGRTDSKGLKRSNTLATSRK